MRGSSENVMGINVSHFLIPDRCGCPHDELAEGSHFNPNVLPRVEQSAPEGLAQVPRHHEFWF